MLAGALYSMALIALIAAMVLSAGLAMTRMTMTRMMQPYIAAGYQRAATALQQRIAAQIAGGSAPYPTPAFTPLPAACANATCTYLTSETIVFTETAKPTAGPACDVSQTNCAPNVQTNSYVGESRLTAQITVNVQNSKGNVLASRSGTVVLRTFGVAPYAAIAGSRDGAFDDITGAHLTGDDGGAPPATPNPCAGGAWGVAEDTTIRVAYRNQTTSRCADGSSWGNASYSATGSSSGWGP
jgi:hypothetical protein